jgi:hypothetical protein
MSLELSPSGISQIIQLAVAPVFLLTGIGSILGVLTGRLGRIVDRARALEQRLGASPVSELTAIRTELARLVERKRWINRAIIACTCCALLICLVIAALFVGEFAVAPTGTFVALVFVAAMLMMIVGLLCFLREIYVAVNKGRVPRGS